MSSGSDSSNIIEGTPGEASALLLATSMIMDSQIASNDDKSADLYSDENSRKNDLFVATAAFREVIQTISLMITETASMSCI